MKPIDIVRSRLIVVHGAPPRLRAKCPAHQSSGGTLAVAESHDGTVLLKCHAGCSASEIVHALGLKIADLFPGSDSLRARSAEIAQERKRYTRSPLQTIRAALERGAKETRERLWHEIGYDRPLRSSDLNEIRARANAIYGTHLEPLRPRIWEGWAPHDTDPAWPALFERQLRQVLIVKFGDPDAQPSSNDLHLAAVSARRDLRDLAMHGESS